MRRQARTQAIPRAPRPSEVGIFADVTATTRKVMQANKGRDTKPEMMVRGLLHRLGYRYRVHRKDLPGKPDLVFGSRRKAIFVHGCFWHAHDASECQLRSTPKTRGAFWEAKFARNKARDARVVAELHAMGWRTFVVWECGLRDLPRLQSELVAFLDG